MAKDRIISNINHIYSSFNYIALLHSLLANVSVHRSRECGTMVAVVQRQPPWFIVFYRSAFIPNVAVISVRYLIKMFWNLVLFSVPNDRSHQGLPQKANPFSQIHNFFEIWAIIFNMVQAWVAKKLLNVTF